MLAPDLLDGDPTDSLTLRELRQVVGATASRFDTRLMVRDHAVQALGDWQAIANSALAAVALAAARIAACGPPAEAGAHDAADYVAKQTGTTAAKARETIAHGDRLQERDATRAKATQGDLSAEQAAAISDAAAVNPDAEDDLLADADTNSLGGLRDNCSKKKAEKQDLEQIEKGIHARRSLRRYRDRDGAEHLHAVGTRRDMSRIDQALKPIIDDIFNQARTKRRPRTVRGVCVRRAGRDGRDFARRRRPVAHPEATKAQGSDPALRGAAPRSHRVAPREDRTGRDL